MIIVIATRVPFCGRLTSNPGLDHSDALLATLGRHSIFRGNKQLHACLLGGVGDGPLCRKCAKCECGDDDLHLVLPKDGRERLDVCIVHGGRFGTLEKGTLKRVAPRASKRYDRSSAVYQCLY